MKLNEDQHDVLEEVLFKIYQEDLTVEEIVDLLEDALTNEELQEEEWK